MQSAGFTSKYLLLDFSNQRILITIYIYIYILSNAKSADGGNDSIFGFSIYNIHVTQNPNKCSM